MQRDLYFWIYKIHGDGNGDVVKFALKRPLENSLKYIQLRITSEVNSPLSDSIRHLRRGVEALDHERFVEGVSSGRNNQRDASSN